MLALWVWAVFAHTHNFIRNKIRSTTVANLFKKYETSEQKENEGVEITIDDAVFICRRAGGGNRRYRAAIGLAAAAPEVQDRISSKDQTVAVTAEDEVTMQAFADSVVIGWRDVLDRNDQPWEFNKENFLDLMRSCPDVWLQLRMAARDLENFRVGQAKAVGEELGKSSSGSNDTAKTSPATKT